MRYWKRINPDGTTRTVESYSHDLDVGGAIEISGAEFEAFIASLPPPPDPVKVGQAKKRAVAAIKANATRAPWGRILYDLAIAQGWIEPG